MRAKNKRNTFALTQLKQRWQQQSATAAPAAAPRPASTAASAPHANPAARHPGAKHLEAKHPEATQPEAKHPAAKHAKARQPTNKPDPKASRSGTRHKPKDTQQAQAPLSQEERQLFQKAMRQVTPLTTRRRQVFHGRHKHSAQAQQRAQLKRAHAQGLNQPDSTVVVAALTDPLFLPATIDENLETYLNPQCGTDVLQKLRRGHWPLEASIDLHGATLERAHQRLETFIQHCLTENYRCLRIVHGKGYGSINQEPVLRQQIRRWLGQLEPVLAYCDCPPHEGGSGAVKVLLRKNRHLS